MEISSEPRYSRNEQSAYRNYLRELFGSIAIYSALLIPAMYYGPSLPEGGLRTAVLVCPMAGFALMIWAIARHIGRLDEYQRSTTLETFSIAAAITAGATFTYGFLENAGYPRLSMFWVWGLMGCAWFLVSMFRMLRQAGTSD